MTAVTTSTTSTASASSASRTATPSLWRTGLKAAVVAAVATVAVAGAASGLGVSLETEPGKAIPVIGFGQLTLFFAVIGIVIARAIGRRARQPRSTFVKTTIALTALSLVPDAILSADVATKLTLMLTHLVAAAIVIPAISSRLPERVTR